MFFWILILLVLNGIVTFAYTATHAPDPTNQWAMMATTFIYIVGLTQTGIVFSAIMRISKSKWGRYFNRLGEVLTLSFIPVAVITLVIILIGGTDHLFYWADGGAAGHGGGHGPVHMSPWLNETFYVWRYVITWVLFYLTSYIYFYYGRVEEKGLPVSYNLTSRLNVLACVVMFFYVWANTNIAWDFGMMIIPHWESTIFPGYFWVGNVFAGAAFLFIIGTYFLKREADSPISPHHLDQMGKLLMGFTLLWIYMFWSQHIVIWYGDLPARTIPFFKQRQGAFLPIFWIMILAAFLVPFLALLFKKVKRTLATLYVVAVVICIGVWISRYLMVVPVFTDGGTPFFFSWTGISLTAGGIASIYLSVIVFRKVFPRIAILLPGATDVGHH